MTEPQKQKPRLSSVWAEARGLLWHHRGPLSIGLALMVVNRLAQLVLPASTKFVVDDVLTDGRAELLLPIALAAGAATLVQALTGFALSQVVSVTAQRAIADMRRTVQAHVIRLPVSYFDSSKVGILISRVMTDAEGIRNLVGTGLIQLVGGLMTATIALGVLLWLNWQMTTAALVLLLLFGGAMSIAFKKLRPIFRERGEITAQVTGRLAEALGGVRIVKTYVTEKREDRTFTKGAFRLFRNIARTITGTSAVTSISTAIVGVLGVLIMLLGGQAILDGTMTLGELVMYVFFIGLLAAPLVQIANIGTQITEAFAGLDRIHEIRRMATEGEQDEAREAVEHLTGDVVFDHVTFEYQTDTPVLHDISLSAPAGTTTALVGPSGSGKSTLIGLIMGFHSPKQGRLLVDGRDLTGMRIGEYRRHLGVVLQDNFLFDGTIYDNIALARPGATRAEVEEAARVAHCHEFIDRFEKGLDTVVGERGVKLSGGQRQRVAIARAILADPTILILDEATSSLDSQSEAMIRDGLRRLRSGRTTFVIAHRLSTIRSADQILVLDEGRIVEHGTHEELLARGGLYRRLYETQQGVELDVYVNPGEDPVPEDEPVHDPVASVAARVGRAL